MIVGDMEIRLRADIARLQADMNQARSVVSGAMSEIEKTIGTVKAAFAALAATLAIKAIADFAKQTIDAAGGLHDMSIQTGASVAALMQFKTIAATSETSIDGIATMLNKLAKNMAVSNDQSKGTGDAIKALGLNFETVRKLAPEQQLLTIAKALDGFRDGAGKSAVAITLFGKEGAKALPFLADLADAADDVTKALTEQEVAAKAALAGMADDFGDNMTKIQLAGDQWKKQISLAILPALYELSQAFLDTANSTTGLKGEIGKLSSDGTITTWARNAVTAVSYIIDAFQILGRIASVITSAIGSTLGIIFSGLAAQFKALNQVAHGDVRDAFNTIKNQISITGSVLSNFGDEVGAAFSDETFGAKLRDRIAQIQQAAAAAKENKPNLDFSDHSISDAAAKKAAAEAEAAAKKEVEAYNSIISAANIRIVAAQQELAAGKKLTEGQKELIKFDEELAAGKVLLTTEDAAAARAALGYAGSLEAQVLAAQHTRDAVQALTDEHDAAFVSLAAETKANQEAVANYGLTKAAIEANSVARLQERLARQSELGLSEETVASLTREIAARQANAAALAQLDTLDKGSDVAKAKELLDVMSSLDEVTRNAASGMADSFGAVGTAIGGLTTALSGFARAQAGIAADLAVSLRDAAGDPVKIQAAQAKAAAAGATAQVRQYADMASAAKGFFKENTAGYKVMQGAEKAFRAYEMAMALESMVKKIFFKETEVATNVALNATKLTGEAVTTAASTGLAATEASAWGITAVVKALASLPFPANLAAGAATLAAVVAIGAAMFGGMGGGGGVDVAKQRQEANGTGSVLGDSTAKSESIANALALVADNTYRDMNISSSMLASLRNIESSLSGLGNLIVRGTGITGDVAPDTVGSAQKLFSSVLGNNSIGEKLTGGLVGKVIGSIFGGATTVLDTGLTAARASLGSILANGVTASQYTDTKKSGGWFSSDKYRTSLSNLGSEVDDQFSLVIGSLASGVKSAADVLGVGGDAFLARLNSFDVNLGKISLKGLTGDQVQEALETAFSKLGDDMARYAIGGLAQFQQVGEGAYETLIRIANDYATVDAVLGSFGKSFGAVGLASVAAREQLIALSGGLDKFTSQGSFFLENYFSDAEKAATLRTAINAQLTPLNGGVEVTTLEQFKQLALAQDLTTASGQQTYTTMMGLAEAFKQLTEYGDASGKAIKSAQQILDERSSLEDKYDELTMTSEQLRAKERATIDASNLALFDLITARQAEIDATDKAQAAVTSAYSALQRSVTAQKTVLADAYKVNSDAVKALITDTGASITKLASLSSALKNSLNGMSAPGSDASSRADAQAQLMAVLAIARAGGALPSADSLQTALSKVSQPSTALFGSFEEYQKDFYQTALTISDLSDLTDSSATIHQQTLDALNAQSATLDATYAAEVARLDTLISWGQAQVDAMNGVDSSVLSLGAAITALGAALGGVGIVGKMPGFAAGGDHAGGWRIVGENGPEAEYTGPSHISTNSQTRQMLDNSGLEAQLDDMNRTLKSALYQIAKNTGKTVDKLDVLEDWDRNGLPAQEVVE